MGRVEAVAVLCQAPHQHGLLAVSALAKKYSGVLTSRANMVENADFAVTTVVVKGVAEAFIKELRAAGITEIVTWSATIR